MEETKKKNKLVDYILTSRDELKKVTWPTQKETTKYTLIVIGLTAFVILFFAVLDFFFSKGLEQFLNVFA